MKVARAALAALILGWGGAAHGATPTDVEVVLETSQGPIEVTILVDRAPLSAAAFLKFVDDGSFSRGGAFYRTVRKHDNDHGTPTINVIQGGLPNPPSSLATVEHESTAQTGLAHRDGTLSLARGAAGTATGATFFICIGDQPSLDAGGMRNADRHGFAAFGRVIKGMDIVRKIHQLPTSATAAEPYLRGQLLDPPVRILRAYRRGHSAHGNIGDVVPRASKKK